MNIVPFILLFNGYIVERLISRVECKFSRSSFSRDPISIQTFEKMVKMSRHIALFSVYNAFGGDKYNILYKKIEEFEDENILKVVEVFKTLKNEGENVHIEHLNANCRLEWIETGQVIGDQ